MDFHTVVRFFQGGGIFMFPIALLMIVGFSIIIERFLFLNSAKKLNRDAFDRIFPLLQKRDYQGVLNFGKSSNAPVSRIITAGLVRMAQSPRRDDIELAMEEGVMEAVPRLELRTGYLATMANVATLLGLLGTISGLSSAFGAVANADPSEKAALLSSSIAVAMNATAFGLLTAIPLLLCHSLLQTKTLEIIDSLEMAGVKCLNIIAQVQEVATKNRTADTTTPKN